MSKHLVYLLEDATGGQKLFQNPDSPAFVVDHDDLTGVETYTPVSIIFGPPSEVNDVLYESVASLVVAR